MSKFNELKHGSLIDAAYWLETEECSEIELRAALLNAFRHIEMLANRVDKLEASKVVMQPMGAK